MEQARGKHFWRIALLALLLVCGIGGGRGPGGNRAYAQTKSTEAKPADSSITRGRAARWRQKRKQKARTLEKPSPTFMQRAITFVTNIGGSILPHRLILSVPQLEIAGFHPVFGGLGGGAGTTAGILYEPSFWRGNNRLAEVEVLGSLRGYYGAGLRFGGIAGPYVGYTYGRYRHRSAETFYGVGIDSKVETEGRFRLDRGVVGGLLGRAVGASSLLGGHVSYQRNRYGSGQGDVPTVTEQFGTTLPGAGTNADYLMLGVFFELDNRDTPYARAFGHRFAPTEPRLRGVSVDASKGFYFAAEVTHNVEVHEHRQDFTRFTLDAREFWPVTEELFHGFSFRQFASVTHSGEGSVPFYRLQAIGGARSLRGYPSGRFRDRNVLLANAEVRCQVWHWMDMAVFVDAGHVSHDLQGMSLKTSRVGYGVGFRLKNDGKTLGRVDIARGDAGWTLHLDLGSLF